MSKDWRTMLRFAVVGIAITPVFFLFDKTDLLSKNWAGIWMFWASLMLCPAWFFGSVLIVNESGLPGPDSTLVWFLIGLVNCFYYASVGAVYVDMRKSRRSMAKI